MCDAEFPQTILDLVLQLVDLVLVLEILSLSSVVLWFISATLCLMPCSSQLRTETTSLLIRDGDSVGLALDKHVQVLSRFCHTDWPF